MQTLTTTHPLPDNGPVTTVSRVPRATAVALHNNITTALKPLKDATNHQQQQKQTQPQVEMTALRRSDHQEDDRRVQGGAIKKQRRAPSPAKAAVIGALMYPKIRENNNLVQQEFGNKPGFPWQQVQPHVKSCLLYTSPSPRD